MIEVKIILILSPYSSNFAIVSVLSADFELLLNRQKFVLKILFYITDRTMTSSEL